MKPEVFIGGGQFSFRKFMSYTIDIVCQAIKIAWSGIGNSRKRSVFLIPSSGDRLRELLSMPDG